MDLREQRHGSDSAYQHLWRAYWDRCSPPV